jgi:hypothetical protein
MAKTKYLKTKVGCTHYRLQGNMYMSVSNYPHTTGITQLTTPIYTEEYTNENFIKSNEQEFNQALEKALHNISNNTL